MSDRVNNNLSSSSSSSTNNYSRSYVSSSSSSSTTTSVLLQTPRGRSMEEVWKDIAQENPHSLRGIILQDFLAVGSLQKPPSTNTTPFTSSANPLTTTNNQGEQNQNQNQNQSEEEEEEEELGPLPLPPTALSLNSSGLGFHSYHHQQQHCSQVPPHTSGSNHNNISQYPSNGTGPCFMVSPASFQDASTTAGLFSFCPKRRPPDCTPDAAGGDRRHKRMMKNRESAARSRARKQAYTNELELELEHLAEENERLKQQHEELRLAMAAQKQNTAAKKGLQRSLTAPF